MVVENTSFWKKKAIFQVKKLLWPIFSRIIECHKAQGTVSKGPKSFLTFTVELIRAFFQDLWGCWKHKFLKKGNICSEKYIAACFFFVLSRVTNLKGRIVRVQQVFWQLLSKLFDHFCYTWEVVENTKFWKRKANFPVKKTNWPTFLVFSSMTNLKEQFLRVHKLFWQIPWNL